MKLQSSCCMERFYVNACMVVGVSVFLLSRISCVAAVVAPAYQSEGSVSDQQASRVPARLQRLLEYYDAHFDDQQQLLQEQFVSPGYHSSIGRGTFVHPIRESFYYAIGLLQRGRPEDISRSKVMLNQVLSLQQVKLNRPGYGVWPWLLEEPLEKMDSIDRNWADFCGSAVAQVLVDHREQLDDADLEKRLRTALLHAATAIRNRNVGAHYTNIAVLGLSLIHI